MNQLIPVAPEPSDCFQDDCYEPAVAVVHELDGSPMPACQQHWDDLSWVYAPGPFLPNEPGWSGG